MSTMTDQGNDKDALLEKLDGLIQSGRARKRRDAPPVLTDAIPTASESDIPTLTDAVEMPDTSDVEQPAEQEEQTEQAPIESTVDLDTPLDFEPAIAVDSKPDAPDGSDSSAPLEPETGIDHRQEWQEDVPPRTAADLQASISSRLVTVIEREMTALIEQIPAHESKLTVLQRSLRFALPELVRLRLQEESAGDSDDDSDDPANAES